ncbi:MAG: InlB B-repeat-containing protein [Clostridia bacterium]
MKKRKILSLFLVLSLVLFYGTYTVLAEIGEGPDPVTYTVSFDVDGGSAVDSQTVEDGETAVLPDPAPTKEGHDFAGWYADAELASLYDFATSVTDDITIYAKWTEQVQPDPITHTVTFASNGGSAIAPQTVEDGETVVLPDPAPTREGYDFAGWYADAELTTLYVFATPVTDDITIYARWTEQVQPDPITHTVTFATYGGSPVASQEVAPGGKVVIPVPSPTKTGSIFIGWYTDEALTNLFDFDVVITAATTLHARWTVLIYNVTFINWNGDILKVGAIPHGSTAIPPAVPERPGYVFAGWNVSFTNVTGPLAVTALFVPVNVQDSFSAPSDHPPKAAPAIASEILKHNGVRNVYKNGRGKGNFIADVARHMENGATFGGFEKGVPVDAEGNMVSNLSYRQAVLNYLNSHPAMTKVLLMP